MPSRERVKLPARVKRLGERIERWRQTRARRTAMPADLWSDAVVLAQCEGAYRIARALRLNFEGLKRRMAEAAAQGIIAAEPAGGFVEMTGAQILGASARAVTVVELADAAGNRVVMRLGPESELDVAGLISAFRQRGSR